MCLYQPICVKFGTEDRPLDASPGIFCMNNTRSNTIVVRNCDVGDFALVLVFLYFFFFLSFLFTATKFKSREQWEFCF